MSKKGSKAAPKEVPSYALRDTVLGKIRGYPPWPGMIVDPGSAPDTVQRERPNKKANFYCVQFFPTGDYAWLVAKDISKLQRHEIESYINEPFKKSGDLLQGYRTALDPADWEASRALALATAQAEADADAEEVDELDELETEDEEKRAKGTTSASASAATKKRKRESEGKAAPAKTRKPPKEKKEKEKKEKEKKAVPAKPRKSAASKTKALVESEDEHAQDEEGAEDAEGEDAGPSKKVSPPPAKKARKDKGGEKEKEDDTEDAKMQADPEAVKVREWRHRLQKAFLSSKSTPEDADMPALDALFSTVESYHAITVAYLQFSKIGKVMRHITLLTEERVPRDAEYRFRERARALVERWQLVLGAGKAGENGGGKEVNGGGGMKEEGEMKEEGGEAGGRKVNGMAAVVGLDTKLVLADMNGDVDMANSGEGAMDEDAADAPGEPEVDGDVAMVEGGVRVQLDF